MLKEIKQDIAVRARKIVKDKMRGVLSTNSVSIPGYPFGSLVHFGLNKNEQFIVLISHIAQHACNIIKDNSVSITVVKDNDYARNADRVTVIGKATHFEDKSITSKYYRFFPEDQDFHKNHNFSFYKIHVEKVRFIGSLGDIHWINSEDFTHENPFSEQEEINILDRMNNDHQTALSNYFLQQTGDLDSSTKVEIVSVDAEGIWIRNSHKIHHLPFNKPVSNKAMLRAILIALAKHVT